MCCHFHSIVAIYGFFLNQNFVQLFYKHGLIITGCWAMLYAMHNWIVSQLLSKKGERGRYITSDDRSCQIR